MLRGGLECFLLCLSRYALVIDPCSSPHHPGCKPTVQDVGSTCTMFTQEVERLLMGNIINRFGKTEGPRMTDGILLRQPDLAMGFANAEYPESVKKWDDLQTSPRRAICRHDGVFGPHVRNHIRDARLWLTQSQNWN